MTSVQELDASTTGGSVPGLVISEAETTNTEELHSQQDVGDIDLCEFPTGGFYEIFRNASMQINTPPLWFGSPRIPNIEKGLVYTKWISSIKRASVHDHGPNDSTIMFIAFDDSCWLDFNSLHNLFLLMFFFAC